MNPRAPMKQKLHMPSSSRNALTVSEARTVLEAVDVFCKANEYDYKMELAKGGRQKLKRALAETQRKR